MDRKEWGWEDRRDIAMRRITTFGVGGKRWAREDKQEIIRELGVEWDTFSVPKARKKNIFFKRVDNYQFLSDYNTQGFSGHYTFVKTHTIYKTKNELETMNFH